MEEQDDGNSGRSGRVRKKSAKVLEMEEFEQAEKVSHVVKKGKSSKASAPNTPASDDNESAGKTSGKKTKLLKSGSANLETATLPTKTVKVEKGLFSETPRAVPAELTLRIPQSQTNTESPKAGSQQASQEFKPGPSTISDHPISVKKEDSKSVIKYLLSSPTAGSTTSAAAAKVAIPQQSTPESANSTTPKAVKRHKSEEKGSKSKPKEKRPKIEILSPSELIPAASAKSPATAPTLKMKITGGTDPLNAQVALDLQESSPEVNQTVKPKKAAKKTKIKQEDDTDVKAGILGLADDEGSPPPKKSKVSKKKEKLIQDAISSAVQQMPNLAALVAAAGPPDVSPPAQKPQKKKSKSSPAVKSEPSTEDDLQSNSFDADAGESMLVIAEKEKKKKKVSAKKKALKEKDEASSQKVEKKVKIPKRAPTAYMLFCNMHRPTIVAENPGIEFAGISRKLGELWQTQSNKQKLQWRRKAQRRMKKSNLISTGKTGKESQGVSGSSINVLPAQARLAQNQKLSNLLQKSKRTLAEEAPLSPTKNFSIEPMDVAAHLRLLGESLSIIGMRLQEHKGMIAVQGSLSVLLDSLICACGPLLCLTQQVPGMDGCSPSLHGQTLDSVAYVMPGL